MESKKFNCKMCDIPVIAGFVLSSMERDIADFVNYSPLFADTFITDVRKKQDLCYIIIRAEDVLKTQKMVRLEILSAMKQLRFLLNKTEGYLEFCQHKLDIKYTDFGIKAVRDALTNKDLEKVLYEGRTLIGNLKRNEPVLQLVGLQIAGVLELSAAFDNIEMLNEKHNSLKNERSRAASNSMVHFNELWAIICQITAAGRALFRGVDEVRLKEYTLLHLKNRVYNHHVVKTNEEN